MKIRAKFVHSKWVRGARITESVLQDGRRRFTATIEGFQNWKLGVYDAGDGLAQKIIAAVRDIQARINAGDESVFSLPAEKGDA